MNSAKRKSTVDIRLMKGKERVAALTAYDFQTAAMIDESGIDVILVGDSLGNVILGHANTLPVTMEDMLHHTRAVARGTKRALLVTDMPFKSYQVSMESTLENACLLLQAGAQAVKLEGGVEVADRIKRMTELGIPVMAHIGLTPQSINRLGTYSMQGKERAEAEKLHNDAMAVESAGAFSVVLECVDHELAESITKELRIPTIGIGSGEKCDGQILVVNDLLGLSVYPLPKFVKPAVNMRSVIQESVSKYVRNVKEN